MAERRGVWSMYMFTGSDEEMYCCFLIYMLTEGAWLQQDFNCPNLPCLQSAPFILLSPQGPHSFESVWKVHSESIQAVPVLFFFYSPLHELQKVNCRDTPFTHVETERLLTVHRLWWQVWGHTYIHPSCFSGHIRNVPACCRHVRLSIKRKQKNSRGNF